MFHLRLWATSPRFDDMANPNPLQHEHETLLDDACRLQERVRASYSNDADVRAELERFGQDLEAHFEREETDGYFTAETALRPECDRRVQSLFAQHAELRRHWRALSDTEPSVLAERVDAFVSALHAHEAEERAFMQDVYLQDLGVGD